MPRCEIITPSTVEYVKCTSSYHQHLSSASLQLSFSDMSTAMDYPLFVKIFNGLQLVSVITAAIAGLVYSLAVLLGMAFNKDSTNRYKDVIIILTVVHFIDCALFTPLTPIITFPTGLIYIFGRYYPTWLAVLLASLADCLSTISAELLAISMVYKVFFLMKPKWASTARIILYGASLPFPILQTYYLSPIKVEIAEACDFVCIDATASYPRKFYLRNVTQLSVIGQIMAYLLYLIVAIVGIPCIWILNKWFRAGAFSSRTMVLQRKLMRAWGGMIILQSLYYMPSLIFWICQFIPASIAFYSTIILTSISVTFIYWILPLRCLIIYRTMRSSLSYPNWISWSNCKKKTTSSTTSSIFMSRGSR